MHIASRVHVENSLLAAVPRKERRHLFADMEQVALTYGEVLCEPDQRIRHVRFPNHCVRLHQRAPPRVGQSRAR